MAIRATFTTRHDGISVGPYVSADNVGERERIVGLSLGIPLPVTGRATAAVEAAGARQRQAEAALVAAQRELERDVVLAAQAFAAKVAESKRWSPDAAQKFREAADLADRHYRTGAVPIATYVELQTSYLEAVEALLETQADALAAGLRLQQLTGLELGPVATQP